MSAGVTRNWRLDMDRSYQRNYEDNQEDQDEVALLDETVNLQSNEIIDTFLLAFHGFGFEKEKVRDRWSQRQQPS